MISENNTSGRNQFTMLTVDDLAPQDHPVRKVNAAPDFRFIYPTVEVTYSDLGCLNIGPVILIKLVFIQRLFDIRSIRQTIKEVDTNVAYHWFLSYPFEEKVLHFSTFGKDCVRRSRETTTLEDIFAYILERTVKTGLVTEDNLYLDSTHIEANANKHKFAEETTHDEAKAYQDELEDEIDHQRIEAGKCPFTLDLEKEVKLKERKVSKADLEGGYYAKGEREKQFTYSAHTSCDDNGFIPSTITTPENIYDSRVAFQFVKQSKRLLLEINCVIADAGYKTPKFVHFLTHLNLRPCLPYSRPKGKKGLLSKNEFPHDECFDCYICSQDQVLVFSAITREGYREYRSSPKKCVSCPLLNRCTKSRNHQRIIAKHIWGDLMDEMEHLRLVDLNKSTYKKRK